MIILKDELQVCSYCRHDFKFRVSGDIGFKFHWVDNRYLIDVVLICENLQACVLCRFVYGF